MIEKSNTQWTGNTPSVTILTTVVILRQKERIGSSTFYEFEAYTQLDSHHLLMKLIHFPKIDTTFLDTIMGREVRFGED